MKRLVAMVSCLIVVVGGCRQEPVLTGTGGRSYLSAGDIGYLDGTEAAAHAGAVSSTGDVPRIVVQRSTRQTTLARPLETHHIRWEWDFGDGNRLTIEGIEHAWLELTHRFRRPGTYTVTAVSVGERDRVLRRLAWTAGVKDAPERHSFLAVSVPVPVLEVVVDGPEQWPAGRLARFEVAATADWPRGLVAQQVTFDPGPQFEVQWPRPMVYEVVVAVTLDRTFDFDGEIITTRHRTLHSHLVVVVGTTLHD